MQLWTSYEYSIYSQDLLLYVSCLSLNEEAVDMDTLYTAKTSYFTSISSSIVCSVPAQ